MPCVLWSNWELPLIDRPTCISLGVESTQLQRQLSMRMRIANNVQNRAHAQVVVGLGAPSHICPFAEDKAPNAAKLLPPNAILIEKSPGAMGSHYSGAISALKMSLRGAYQREAVLALTPSGKSLSTELWILLTV